MKRKFDPDMPIGRLRPVKSFLPPPSKLVFPTDNSVKVTIYLSKFSVEFFKKQAKMHKTKYQRMIRELLDRYAALHMAL